MSHEMSHYASLANLVPDVFFVSWLCFCQQKNVWATRHILGSRIKAPLLRRLSGPEVATYTRIFDWYVDGTLVLMRGFHAVDAGHDGNNDGLGNLGHLSWENTYNMDGKRHGTWRLWTRDGTPYFEIIWDNDKVVLQKDLQQ